MKAVRDARNVLVWTWRHPANRRHRVRGVTRALAFQVRGRFGLRSTARVGERCRISVALHEAGGSKALYANPPDWNEMRAWSRLLAPGDLFVDVGSNVGTYALWAADAGATVIAIEPGPTTAQRLRENVGLNDLPITVLECALAAKPGSMLLSRGLDTTNHLLLDSGATGDCVEVETLDNVVGERTVAGMKIDVEGAERLVLEGARAALSSGRIRAMQIEWNSLSHQVLGESRKPISDLLQGFGFRFCRPDQEGVLRPSDPDSLDDSDIFAVLD